MGCKLSVHVVDPQQGASERGMETLRATIADLQTAVQVLQEVAEAHNKNAIVDKKNKPEQAPFLVVKKNKGKSSGPLNNVAPPKKEEEEGPPPAATKVAPPESAPPTETTPPEAAPASKKATISTASTSNTAPITRVPLKATVIIEHLIQSVNAAERKALENLVEIVTDAAKKSNSEDGSHHASQKEMVDLAALAWQDYDKFVQHWNRLLQGKDCDDSEKDWNNGLLRYVFNMTEDMPR